MNFPKQTRNISRDRCAVAPYNFVELPNKIVEVAESDLPKHDRYYGDRYTGKIKCTLTTESPLYIRCGLSSADFKKFGEKSTSLEDLERLTKEERERRTNFFNHLTTLEPILPGSSLRGMLRNLVEIVSFSKIERVSGDQKLFFRAVATDPSKDSLAAKYKYFVKPEVIKAGYLREENGNWYIYPAKSIKGVTFAWVRESDLDLPDFLKFDDASYHPQYVQVSYSSGMDNSDRAKRTFADDVNIPEAYPMNQGILVTSGNMKLADEASPRRNHCLVFEIDTNTERLKIDDVAIQHYCNALTDFQKDIPFNEELGVLKNNRPIFYSIHQQNNVVGFFGQSPNFRIPYSIESNGQASTALNFLPEKLRDSSLVDIADAIFGYVGKDKQKVKEESCAGRVFFEDAKTDEELPLQTIKPKILGSPKTTTFQHYLVQPDASRKNLKHYANKPNQETVIRGHKLYWRKGNVSLDQVRERDLDKLRKGKKQITEIKPIKAGTIFTFDISFENLSKVELGALLWVLSLSSDKAQGLGIGKTGEQYCFSLGMGKPLGMGAVKIDYQLHLSDRPQRYNQLFDQNSWAAPEKPNSQQFIKACVEAFELFMLDPETGIHEADHPAGRRATRLAEIPRIEMLLAMLRCDRTPESEAARYMTIEAKEYANRPVLPTPLQVMNVEDNRRMPESQTQAQSPQQRSRSNTSFKKTNSRPPDNGEGVNPALQRAPRPPKR